MEEAQVVEGEVNTSFSKLNESITSKKSRKTDHLYKSKDSSLSKEDFKFDIPESCYQVLMKGLKIEKLKKKFLLIAHPYPIVEGEMLLFQPLK